MNQRWWIAIVGVVGIGLAFLLFPRPDTGDDIPAPNPANTDPFKEGAKRKSRPPIDPSRISTDPTQKPGMAELIEKRNRPEVVYATKLVTPFSAMRYNLSRTGADDAKALADEIAATMAELRNMRTNPDGMAWADLQSKTDAMINKVAASPYGSDESIVKSITKYKGFIAEYEAAKSGAPIPGTPEGEGAPEAPGTPDEAPEGEANP